MNRKLVSAVCAVTLGGALLLGGCQKTDVQTSGGVAVVRDDAGAQYSLVTARVGDLSLTENVRVKYFAARQESYGFGESGLYYDTFPVSVGDEVKAGDVLATLDAGELDSGIAQCRSSIAETELILERNRQLVELCESRLAGRTPSASEKERLRGYQVAIRDAEDQIDVLKTRLDELNAQKEGRVITAAIGGTVTYVRDVENGETSTKGKVVVTVTDLSSCAFSATVEHPEAIEDGAIYTLRIGGEEYEITPTTAEELGIEPEPMNEKSTMSRVYFSLLTPSVNLNSDSTGSFPVTVDQRQDVGYVPATAVSLVDGVSCVYVPDEQGLCTTRNVTTGLETQRYVEILDGLDAGDSVIQF